MQTLSSASRTCIASASAVEWTATVAMPSSLQARSTRSAISPRLAIRILSNMTAHARDLVRSCPLGPQEEARTRRPQPATTVGACNISFNDHQGLTELDRLG